MAGHFILRSITASDLAAALDKGCVWSALQHVGGSARPAPPGGVYPGWNALGTLTLTTALGAGIAARDDLPPHRYLQFGPIAPGFNPYTYIQNAGWADMVVRPNMGLRALTAPAAVTAWNNGHAGQAVFHQALAGAVSVEVYYLSGVGMS